MSRSLTSPNSMFSELESWVAVARDSDFPIQNLPYGAFAHGPSQHIGVAIGQQILDLHALAHTGLLGDICDREILTAPNLNPLLAAGRTTWSALRARLIELLQLGNDEIERTGKSQDMLIEQRSAQMRLPFQIGDYVDFYSSLEHATNLGKIFRPDGEALMPNWRHLPIGYHGRSSTIVIDDTPIVRPSGQSKAPTDESPSFGPSKLLDIELEIGFVTGPGNALGAPIATSDAREHIFGLILVNDWSARDIQAWEYQPLGPFLGKSFATSISPWVVTLEALEPFRIAGPTQNPVPLKYLRVTDDWGYDIRLQVSLQSQQMRLVQIEPAVISATNFKDMYWNMAQQLAHATANGAVSRPGDLYASGTISGTTPDSLGSFIELTWRGARPLHLPSGETRAFLEDGDTVTLHGWCEKSQVRRIGFGQVRGTILPAQTPRPA